nr:hypothetical protein [Streptomyces sp. TLI_235]
MPGDLDQLGSMIGRLNQVAELVGRFDALVRAAFRSVADGGFVGQTADALRGKLDSLVPQYVATIASAFGQAAEAMDRFRAVLAEQQSRADDALAGAVALGPRPDSSDPTRLAGWQEATARFKEQAREAAAEVDAAAFTAATALREATAAAPEFRDGSNCWDTFWTAVGWVATVVTIPALFLGGPFALAAWGLGVAQFVKAGVDLAEGQGTVGDFLLSTLGILAPTTKPLLSLEQLGKLTSSLTGVAKTVLTSGVDGVISLVKSVADIGHGLLEAPLSTVAHLAQTTVMVPASVVWRGGDLFMNGLRLTPDYLRRIGAALIDTAHALPSAAWEQLRDWRWIGIFLPVAVDEIRAYGVAGAFGKGILERGLGFSSHTASLAFDILSGAAHGGDSALRLHPGDAALGGGAPLKLTDHGLLIPAETAVLDGTAYLSGPHGLLLPDSSARPVGLRLPGKGLFPPGTSRPGTTSFSAGPESLASFGGETGFADLKPVVVPDHLTHPVVFTAHVPQPSLKGAPPMGDSPVVPGAHWPTPDMTRPATPTGEGGVPPAAPLGDPPVVSGAHWPTPDMTRPATPIDKGSTLPVAPADVGSPAGGPHPWGGNVVHYVGGGDLPVTEQIAALDLHPDAHQGPSPAPADLSADRHPVQPLSESGGDGSPPQQTLLPPGGGEQIEPVKHADDIVVQAPREIVQGSDDQVRKYLMGLAKNRIDQLEKEISAGVRDTLPGAFGAGIDRVSGRVFFGESGSADGLADAVLDALPQESLHPAGRPPGVCAEGRVCTGAINAGVKPGDLYIITVNARGKKFKMCVNCASWVPDFVGKVLTG